MRALRLTATSSRAAFPHLSPSPLAQVWITCAPASTAARALAMARPRSLWV